MSFAAAQASITRLLKATVKTIPVIMSIQNSAYPLEPKCA